MYEFCQVSTIPSILVNVCPIDYSYPNRNESVSHCHLSFISKINVFSSAYWPFTYFIWKKVYSISSAIVQIELSFYCCIINVLYIFWIQVHYICNLQKKFLSVCGSYFLFIDGIL